MLSLRSADDRNTNYYTTRSTRDRTETTLPYLTSVDIVFSRGTMVTEDTELSDLRGNARS